MLWYAIASLIPTAFLGAASLWGGIWPLLALLSVTGAVYLMDRLNRLPAITQSSGLWLCYLLAAAHVLVLWLGVIALSADGTLDPVMAHKAEHGDKTAEEYRAYYNTGYATDVDAISFDGQTVTFTANGESYGGEYVSDGYEILNYKKGNRGVRYIFKKDSGDDAAPDFIQFSDHHIAPETVGHYHLYWGDDRAKVLEELTNWPTYYPADLSGEDILHEMLAH